MLSEANIIQSLSKEFPEYIGDDAAVLHNIDKPLLISKDILVEDVHFRCKYFSPKDLAHKAIHVNLSDIAAMGANPKYIMTALAIPDTHHDYAINLTDAFINQIQHEKLILIGGDTTRSPGPMMISVTIFGEQNLQQIKYRKGAEDGDILCFIGEAGYAHLGFLALEHAIDSKHIDVFKHNFLKPQAKRQEGLWLAEQTSVTSMMDCSDSIYQDVQKLLKASNVGTSIDVSNIYLETHFKDICESLNINPIDIFLSGGEDYGLIFTVKPDLIAQLEKNFYNHFKYSIQKLGHITSKPVFTLMNKTIPYQMRQKPFTHFGELNAV